MVNNNERKHRGVMVSQYLKGCETIKQKKDAFMNFFPEYESVKISIAVFNRDAQCVRIQKYVELMDLFRFLSWHGYRGAIDQVIVKMKLTLEAEKDTVYNICLDRDFNLNIHIIPKLKEQHKIAI